MFCQSIQVFALVVRSGARGGIWGGGAEAEDH